MTGSRMINTLAVLLVALTVGTLVLMAMETDPIVPEVRDLIASGPNLSNPLDIIEATDSPLQPAAWRNIVVLSADSVGSDLAARSHFVIDFNSGSPQIAATSLWKAQRSSYLVSQANSTFNSTVVAVCLVGDFSSHRPSQQQMHSLLALVRSLQDALAISLGHVYCHSDLVASSDLPGRAFPVSEFNAGLLRLR